MKELKPTGPATFVSVALLFLFIAVVSLVASSSARDWIRSYASA